MKSIVTAFVVAAFVGSAAAADAKIDSKKLVGKWELTKSSDEGAPKGAIIEFTKDGKVAFSFDFNGKKLELSGKYEVKEDKLTITITPPGAEKEVSDTDTIKSLSDEKLILVDSKSKESELTKKK